MKHTTLPTVLASLLASLALASPASAEAAGASPWDQFASADDAAPAAPQPETTSDYAAPNRAKAPSEKISAEVDFAAYFWASSLGGRAGTADGGVSIDVSFLDLLDDTDHMIGFMGHAELDINRFLIMLDPVWTKLEKDDAVPGAAVETDATVKTLWFDIDAGYRFIDHKPLGGDDSKTRLSLDGYVGGRITGLKFELEPDNAPSVSSRQTWADPIIGGRVSLDLGENVGLVFRADIGGFGASSDLTSNLLAGLGYRFPLGEDAGIAIFVGFRALYQDYQDDDFDWRVWVYGPLIGAQISF